MIKLGVNTVLFGERPFREAMEHVKWAGFDAAEVSALPGMADHLPLDNWKAVAGDIKAVVEDLELPLTAVEVAATSEERLLPGLEASAEIGIPVVNVGGGGYEMDNEDDLKRLIDHMNAMSAKAEEFGVVLCLKAHVNTACYSTPTTLRVMEGVQSPAFGVDMDPSHIHRAGEVPKEALASVISRVKHVHIRDCVGLGPSPGAPELQACGRGDIDLMGYCKVLVDNAYDGPVNLEVIGAKDYPLSRQAIIAAESYGYLNACLKAVGGR